MSNGQTAQSLYLRKITEKILLSYMKCSILYFVTVCGTYIRQLARHRMAYRYVNSMRKRRPIGGVAETKAIKKLTFIHVGRYGHFQTEWTSLKDIIYADSQIARSL